MYRKSSKGNPYHDALGRFTSAGAKGSKGIRGGDTSVKMWSSFGEKHTQKDLEKQYRTIPKTPEATKELWEKADRDKSKIAREDGRRHYHYQSVKREDNAKELANYKIPPGTPKEQWGECVKEAIFKFKRENKVAFRRGAKFVPMFSGTESKYQVVESKKMTSSITQYMKKKNRESATINTATHMKQFSGFTVEFTKGNNTVRSCKSGASPKEISDAISKYCSKHKKELSDKNTCIKIWRNGDRVFFMPVYHFKSREDAEKFAKDYPTAKIIDNDDNGME